MISIASGYFRWPIFWIVGLTTVGMPAWLCAQPVAVPPAVAAPPELTTPELIERLNASQGQARTDWQLQLLKRLDAPIEDRERASDELIERFKDQDNPAILGAAYAGKGKVLGDRLDYTAAVEVLEIAEGYGRRCVETDPGIFFKARCNRAVYLNAQGQRDEPTRLLLEAIEFAKPYGDRLDLPFAYGMLGRLAEAAGAIDKAFEYLQASFELATRWDKGTLAAQAGISILELALSEEKVQMAEDWLPRIEPWIAKSRDPRMQLLLALRREDLKRMQGDPQGAAQAVQQLIDAHPRDGDAQSKGLLYLSLAASHFASKNYEAAFEASNQGAEILKPVFRSWTLTQLNRMESLFALGRADEALAAAEQLLGDTRLVSLHRIRLLEFKSRILAKLNRHSEALAALQACREAEAQRATNRAHEVAQFIIAAYDARQQEAELSTAKAKQQAAEYQAELNQEIALREHTAAANDRFIKYIAICASLLTLLVGLLFIRSHFNRRAAVTIAQRERELNEELQVRLDKQTRELKEETSARQQLELAVERKFRDEALGKLTGGVAHDFNNLLTVVLHSVDLLRRQNPQIDDDSQLLLNAIHNAAESGSTIVSQLMAYTRQQPLEPKPLALSSWLATTRTMLKQSLGNSIEFIENDQSGNASICIDSAQLTTAIINLFVNARDAICPNSGTVQLVIQRLDLDESNSKTWSSLPHGRYAHFQVIDNGKGMSPEELTHACEPFFTTKPPGAGTGLGLSTVLGFVKQSGGELQLRSQPGQGTTVSFLLPLTDKEALTQAEPTPLAASGHPSQLLLVEDQEAVRLVLAAGLKSIGYEVTQAAHAAEAMAIISQSGAPRILLSDVRMPGAMDGVQLRRWVLERFPNVHVVLMSGYRDIDANDDADNNIVFLQKPVKLQELHRALSLSSN